MNSIKRPALIIRHFQDYVRLTWIIQYRWLLLLLLLLLSNLSKLGKGDTKGTKPVQGTSLIS